MSENTADYNKRTCIICGCHTSQTINIHEPRTGPNIVQLIQARFKFQPLNDDKYLCYSCNNWLINWHSLQAVNSNNADNSASTFRTNLNNAKPDKSSILYIKPKTVQGSKPIAIVKPRIRAQSYEPPKGEQSLINDRIGKSDQSNLGILSSQRQRTTLQKCRSSSRAFEEVTPVTLRPTTTIKCKHYLQINHSPEINSDAHSQNEVKSAISRNSWCNLVNKTPYTSGYVKEKLPLITLPYLPRKNSGKLIDGKVVSMLRRIGTTLSRDLKGAPDKYEPSTGTPVQNTQVRRQDIVDDEILINFNTAISEVLYYNEKKSTYDVINSPLDPIVISSSEDEDEESISIDPTSAGEVNASGDFHLEQVFSLVPKGLSVSLISDSC